MIGVVGVVLEVGDEALCDFFLFTEGFLHMAHRVVLGDSRSRVRGAAAVGKRAETHGGAGPEGALTERASRGGGAGRGVWRELETRAGEAVD